MIFYLGLALLVDGHHPLPKQLSVGACAQAEPALRSILRSRLTASAPACFSSSQTLQSQPTPNNTEARSRCGDTPKRMAHHLVEYPNPKPVVAARL